MRSRVHDGASGFGLVNEQGIHKPTFHAMAMLARLGDRQRGDPCEQFGEHGVVGRIQMLDHHVSQATVGRHVSEKRFQRFETAC